MTLQVRGLSTSFGAVRVVDHVDLDLAPGEVLGLVGESGSGKSVTLRSILRLVRPPGRVTGQVFWRGRDLLRFPDPVLRDLRGREIAMIFQEPLAALNPVLSIGLQIDESLKAHSGLRPRARAARAVELLELVGVPDARRRIRDYPHQFSGGMRQRAMIAIALASEPALLLADEPTTALDVTIQDQILKLLLELRDRTGMSVLFVTHDLGVVATICDRVAVMYAGRIVETAPAVALFDAPQHPYTHGLLGAVPRAGAERRRLQTVEGSPPPLGALPPGCAFAPRCGRATGRCEEAPPPLAPLGEGRAVACYHHG